jgi:hypothetical protein
MKNLWILLAVLLAGCSSVPVSIVVPPIVIPPIVQPNDQVHSQVRGVFCGLLYTSIAGDNQCPGADVDADSLFTAASAQGVRSVLLLNDQCTWEKIKTTAMAQAEGLGRGDMLIFTLSGHGTQLPDDNGDEADGLDEALCLFSDTGAIDIVRDDRVMTELLVPLWTAHPGLDIFMLTDTCHSEGNFRSLWRWITGEQPSRTLISGPGQPVDGALVQIAMCREASYSYGTNSGGTGTQALLKALAVKIGRLGAFVQMQLYMDIKEQQPVWSEFGQVSSLLRNGEFWK